MSDINQVVLVGRLTRDPELKYTPTGAAVATMTIAVGRKYKKGEEMVDEVCFVDVVVWNKLAEAMANNLSKGSRIGVTGKLIQQTWQTKEGDKRSTYKVQADSIQFLSEKKTSENKPAQTAGDTSFDTSAFF